MTSERNLTLATFAKQVLTIMEAEKDWSPDTMEEIDQAARDLGLAGNDVEGFFEVISPKASTR